MAMLAGTRAAECAASHAGQGNLAATAAVHEIEGEFALHRCILLCDNAASATLITLGVL
ncbi:hypothetical protein XAB3213_300003 [Xanthomonas citri pv. bilvae]|nr:hypothetical protein XAB3213_300003 [Xanthomonas citri pv. bilvae]